MAIVDFSHPNLIGKEGTVRVIKTTQKGDLYPQNTRFENKDDAFKYYEQVRLIWQKQRSR